MHFMILSYRSLYLFTKLNSKRLIRGTFLLQIEGLFGETNWLAIWLEIQ